MNPANVTTIFRKELTDTLRDRRTLIFMLLVPIVAIPALMMGISKLMISQVMKLEAEAATVAVTGLDYIPSDLREKLEAAEGLSVRRETDFPGENVIDKVRVGELDAALVFRQDFGEALDQEEVTKAEI
ncbi:MAG: hypothetical protein AB1744_07280, partial [Candidatus Zixiibacteriota bacterium]